MGNKHSSPSSEPTLPPVAPGSSSRLPPDAVALRDLSPLVRTSATKLSAEYLDGIAFLVYDQATGELLFTLDERWEFPDYYFDDGKMLVDSKGEPLVIVETKYATTNRYLIKASQAPHSQLYEIVPWVGYQSSGMQLRFTDASSSEKVLIEAENNYKERKSVLWLTRGEVVARKKKKRVEWRELVGAITLKEDFRCEIEVEPKVDLTIIALLSGVLHSMRGWEPLFRDLEASLEETAP